MLCSTNRWVTCSSSTLRLLLSWERRRADYAIQRGGPERGNVVCSTTSRLLPWWRRRCASRVIQCGWHERLSVLCSTTFEILS